MLNQRLHTIFTGLACLLSTAFISGCGAAPEKDKPMADETRTGFMIVCTQDVKQCPDGSYVSRQGHRCEFAKCPDKR